MTIATISELSVRESHFLELLAEKGRNIHEIRELVALGPRSTRETLTKLRQKGLVDLRPDLRKIDGRQRLWFLTKAGKMLVDQTEAG